MNARGCRAMRRAAGALLALSAALPGCGDDGRAAPPAAPVSATRAPAPEAMPNAVRECSECHARVVNEYLGHAMSDSLGPGLPRALPREPLVNPRSGTRYEFADGPPRLLAQRADGTRLAAAIVGRIGAGRADASFVGRQLFGPATDAAQPARLLFLPVEQFADGRPELAPFEHAGDVVLGQPVTAECLECHTTASVAALPQAAADPLRRRVYPSHSLGDDALARLPPLGCDACHGDTRRHVDVMRERVAAAPDDIGLPRLLDLPAATQRDVCSRCHLDGELRVELQPLQGYGPRARDLIAERPVLVPDRPSPDFRFVSQMDRLALSACFRGSPGMTCTTCHAPHLSVAAQGTAAFDAACQSCHARQPCVRPAGLDVESAAGTPTRTPEGCVDCHVRRSQPYDLQHVRTADHHVRRRIEPPQELSPRLQHDARAGLRVFDDGRLSAALATPEGRRWSDGLLALGLWKLGRPAEAAALLETFPPPGSPQARLPTAPPGLQALESSANFHHLRGLVLEATGRPAEARAAYGDALALDEAHPEARVNRASLGLAAGDPQAALQDAALLLQLYPRAEKGWNLRALAAAQAGNLPAASEALRRSLALWPGDAAAWQLLGRLHLRQGAPDQARDALAAAAALDASLSGLRDDLAAAGAR